MSSKNEIVKDYVSRAIVTELMIRLKLNEFEVTQNDVEDILGLVYEFSKSVIALNFECYNADTLIHKRADLFVLAKELMTHE